MNITELPDDIIKIFDIQQHNNQFILHIKTSTAPIGGWGDGFIQVEGSISIDPIIFANIISCIETKLPMGYTMGTPNTNNINNRWSRINNFINGKSIEYLNNIIDAGIIYAASRINYKCQRKNIYICKTLSHYTNFHYTTYEFDSSTNLYLTNKYFYNLL